MKAIAEKSCSTTTASSVCREFLCSHNMTPSQTDTGILGSRSNVVYVVEVVVHTFQRTYRYRNRNYGFSCRCSFTVEIASLICAGFTASRMMSHCRTISIACLHACIPRTSVLHSLSIAWHRHTAALLYNSTRKHSICHTCAIFPNPINPMFCFKFITSVYRMQKTTALSFGTLNLYQLFHPPLQCWKILRHHFPRFIFTHP